MSAGFVFDEIARTLLISIIGGTIAGLIIESANTVDRMLRNDQLITDVITHLRSAYSVYTGYAAIILFLYPPLDFFARYMYLAYSKSVEKTVRPSQVIVEDLLSAYVILFLFSIFLWFFASFIHPDSSLKKMIVKKYQEWSTR